MEKTIRKTAAKITQETLFILLTVAGAVILPQILHLIGAQVGVGGQLGQMLLPMYLPVMILGFYRGACSGAIVGLIAPLVSFALTAMPAEKLLPYIAIELVATGLLAGLFAKVQLPAMLRVFTVQVLAKAVRLISLTTVLLVSGQQVTSAALTAGILTSVPGLILQLLVVSYIIVKKDKANG